MASAPETFIDPSDARIAALLAAHRPGHALAQPFYAEPAIFGRDVERILLRDWHFVCHASELPAIGDWRTFEMAGESVIVVRAEDGELRALANVCRHRGSRLCESARGNAGKRFVCPYHGWTYALDGSLRAARFTQPGFDATEHGLLALPVAEFHGLVLVSLGDAALSLAPARAALDAPLAAFDLAATQVAAFETCEVAANWKLALENYMECYHCGPAHPDYARRHWLAQPRERWAERMQAIDSHTSVVGTSIDRYAERAVDGLQFFYGRTPLRDGIVTGSEDGQPLAPLLGRLEGYDGAATDLMLGATTYALLYADHAVVYSFIALAPQRTRMTLTWLVRAGAREGVDYDRERLTWLWHVTTAADKRIVELNQQGVNSRFYRPGPYSAMETEARRFAEWYLSAIA